MQYRLLVCSTLLLAAAWANADDTPAIQQVQVGAGGADQRQRDTTAVIVVGHDELIRQGDSTLADALKRLPGVSIAGVQGQGGEIRLHGLGNGYTQIMLNGVPVPTGFSLDSIAPELIERVETRRSPAASTSCCANRWRPAGANGARASPKRTASARRPCRRSYPTAPAISITRWPRR